MGVGRSPPPSPGLLLQGLLVSRAERPLAPPWVKILLQKQMTQGQWSTERWQEGQWPPRDKQQLRAGRCQLRQLLFSMCLGTASQEARREGPASQKRDLRLCRLGLFLCISLPRTATEVRMGGTERGHPALPPPIPGSTIHVKADRTTPGQPPLEEQRTKQSSLLWPRFPQQTWGLASVLWGPCKW